MYVNSRHRFVPAARIRRQGLGFWGMAPAPASVPAPSTPVVPTLFSNLAAAFTGGSTPPPPTTPPKPSSSGWDKVWDSLKTVAAAAGKTAEEYIKIKGQEQAWRDAYAAKQGGTPGWVLPVAIGGGVLLLTIVLLKRK